MMDIWAFSAKHNLMVKDVLQMTTNGYLHTEFNPETGTWCYGPIAEKEIQPFLRLTDTISRSFNNMLRRRMESKKS